MGPSAKTIIGLALKNTLSFGTFWELAIHFHVKIGSKEWLTRRLVKQSDVQVENAIGKPAGHPTEDKDSYISLSARSHCAKLAFLAKCESSEAFLDKAHHPASHSTKGF